MTLSLEWLQENLPPEVFTTCEKCGKQGEYHDIPTLTYPDGKERTLCEKCKNPMTMKDEGED